MAIFREPTGDIKLVETRQPLYGTVLLDPRECRTQWEFYLGIEKVEGRGSR